MVVAAFAGIADKAAARSTIITGLVLFPPACSVAARTEETLSQDLRFEG